MRHSKAISAYLALVLGLGVAVDASACTEADYQRVFERVAVRDDGRDPHDSAVAWCEAASWPGTYEWAAVRASRCPDFGTSWAEQGERGMWHAVCGTDDGTPWLTVRP